MNTLYAKKLQKPYEDLTISTIEAHENSVVVKAQVSRGHHTIWLIGDTNKPKIQYTFTTIEANTNYTHEIPTEHRYINTVTDGARTYHIIQTDLPNKPSYTWAITNE